MKTYSFRAECLMDIERFQRRCRASFPHVLKMRKIRLKHEDGRESGEIAVELHTPLGLDYLRGIMRQVVDGHVMLQTLRPIPLAENKLERDFTIE